MTGVTDGVVQALRGLVETYGIDRVTTDAAWVRNILADLSPETRAFNRVLMVAVQEGIPADLRRAATGGSVALAIARGVDRLVGDYGTDRGIATDVVNAWARVLGLAGTVAPAPVPPPPVPTATPPAVPVAPQPVPSPATTPSRRKPDDNEIWAGAGADLSECDLSHRDLSWHDLRRANLSEADLRGANLSGAQVEGVVGVDLWYVSLDRAALEAAVRAGRSLQSAHLAHRDLSEADLRWADLTNANLREADLTGANLDGSIGYKP